MPYLDACLLRIPHAHVYKPETCFTRIWKRQENMRWCHLLHRHRSGLNSIKKNVRPYIALKIGCDLMHCRSVRKQYQVYTHIKECPQVPLDYLFLPGLATSHLNLIMLSQINIYIFLHWGESYQYDIYYLQ